MNPEELLRKRLARNRYLQIEQALKKQRLLDTAPRAAQYQSYQVDGGGIIDLLGGGWSVLVPVTNGLVLTGQGVEVRRGSFDAPPYVRDEVVELEKKETYPFAVLFVVDEEIKNEPGDYYVKFYVGGHKNQPELIFTIKNSDISTVAGFSYGGFVHNYGNKFEASIVYCHVTKGDIIVNIFGETDVIEIQSITANAPYSPNEYVPCLYKGNLIWQSYEFEPYIDTFNANINQPIPSLSVSKDEYYLSESLMKYIAGSTIGAFNRSIDKSVDYKLPFIDSKFQLQIRFSIAGDTSGRPDTGYKTWNYENLNLLVDWKGNFIYEKVNYEQRSELVSKPAGIQLGVGSTVLKQRRPVRIEASQKFFLQSKLKSSPVEIDSNKNVFMVLSSIKLNLASTPKTLELKEGFPSYYPINNINYEFYPFDEYIGQSVLIAENDNNNKGCFLAVGKVSSFTVTDEGKVLDAYAGDFYPVSINVQVIINISIETVKKVSYVSFSSDNGTVIVHNGSFNCFLLSQVNLGARLVSKKYIHGRYPTDMYMNSDFILDFSYHRQKFEFFGQSDPIPLGDVQVITVNNYLLQMNKNWFRDSVYVARVPEEVKTKDSTGYAEEWKISQDGKIFRQDTVKTGKVFSLKHENARILSVSYYPLK